MIDMVILTCPSCGGKLSISGDIERFACGYCGSEMVVRRGGGIISLAPVVDRLKIIEIHTDKTASELAILRLKAELNDINKEMDYEARSVAKTRLWLIFLAVSFGLVGIAAIIADSTAFGIILILITVLLVYGAIKIGSSKLAMLESEKKNKQAELQKHMSVVNK